MMCRGRFIRGIFLRGISLYDIRLIKKAQNCTRTLLWPLMRHWIALSYVTSEIESVTFLVKKGVAVALLNIINLSACVKNA